MVNELRNEIALSELFEEEHKRRILGRLEKLQTELHKKMSNIDMLLGLIGDAGVVLGKFGEDAKPFVDRIVEIAEIGWRTQSSAEGIDNILPFPLLTGGAKEKAKRVAKAIKPNTAKEEKPSDVIKD